MIFSKSATDWREDFFHISTYCKSCKTNPFQPNFLVLYYGIFAVIHRCNSKVKRSQTFLKIYQRRDDFFCIKPILIF
ncbi:MAG: hypothetical protein BGO40_13770 [Chryseobacterium sp. 39-10]|nr:MAG: hypothetical protein BGO40_13770 [Chryseobacterium sp. 39-10]